MSKSIISKILAIIIFIVAGYSVIWFFKTSSTKKYLSAAIASADGKIAAGTVTVSGFPFSQKIIIEEFKFQTDNLSEKLSLSNKYQIVIKKIEANSGLFSNDFKINNIGEISFQDSNGNSGSIEFNQAPEISFSFASGNLTKLSYKDLGYKIIDAARTSLYEGGSSFVEFESTEEADDKIRHKIKAEFKDVDGADIFTDKKIQAIAPAPSDLNIDVVPTANSSTTSTIALNPEPTIAIQANESSSSSNFSLKKYFYIDLEYLLSAKAPEGEVPNLTVSKSHKIESVNVKGLEISSPIYKITADAEFNSGEDGSLTATCSGNIKVEKISNIIAYVKKAINVNSKYNSSGVATSESTTQDNQANISTTITSSEPVTIISVGTSAAMSESDFTTIIVDLAKKNNATMDNISVFSIKRDKGGEFMINDTPLSELITKLIPTKTPEVSTSPAS